MKDSVKTAYCVLLAACVLIRFMWYDDERLLDERGPETIAEYEKRACISVRTLLDAIRHDRVRHPINPTSLMPDSLSCNQVETTATGVLRLHEETKAYKMMVFIAEFRDGPESAKFSMRHAYTTASIARSTLIAWRSYHKLFDGIVDAIQEEMIDTMRAEAYRRSVVGVDEALVHQGLKTGETVKKYSDSLLQFTLSGYDSKFRSKDVNMNVSGSLDSTINIEGVRDRLAQRLQQKSLKEE